MTDKKIPKSELIKMIEYYLELLGFKQKYAYKKSGDVYIVYGVGFDVDTQEYKVQYLDSENNFLVFYRKVNDFMEEFEKVGDDR